MNPSTKAPLNGRLKSGFQILIAIKKSEKTLWVIPDL
jgi:hypothetical protein